MNCCIWTANRISNDSGADVHSSRPAELLSCHVDLVFYLRSTECPGLGCVPMHIALRLNLYRSAELTVPVDLVQAADDLGYHSVWSAEAYGTDALSPLAYLAALTRRIKLGTAVVQLAARPPATLAMHAMTIDALAGGGRVIIGIGVSGPQIVEGWYGQPWGHPTERLRDYVAIVRKVIDRRARSPTTALRSPFPTGVPGRLGQGKALRSILHASAPIPIWMASGGPRNTELCAEVGDGWLPDGPRSRRRPCGTSSSPGREKTGWPTCGFRDVHRLSASTHRRRRPVLDGCDP